MVFDFHTHAFPDELARVAMPRLEDEGKIKAALDGRVASLLESMDGAGIDRAVLLSVATRPDQFDAILKWSHGVASDRLTPFPSIHPADPDPARKTDIVAGEGFKGIKLHPYYQQFNLDDERVYGIYERAEERGLIILCHTGYDVAFTRVRRADPHRIVKVLNRFPRLKFVATHLGAWGDWDEVRDHLIGQPIYIEISYSLSLVPPEQSREMILSHPPDRMLFGSDSPWFGQAETLAHLRALDIEPALLRRILWDNAKALLGEP